MNKEIRDMAEKAGVLETDYYDNENAVEAFAALVAASEREACAKVCEDLFDPRWQSEHNAASQCAEAIRARGETK